MNPLDRSLRYRLTIRGTRAARPGLAAEDEQRGLLYVSAIQQFEDLLRSAEAAGYAGRPVPLFYALSQAGRAIVAAFGRLPRVDGHGLRERRTSDAQTGLLAREIVRTPSKQGTDAFGAVAAAIGSQTFDGAASLGSIWAATPGASELLLVDWEPGWLPPLLGQLGCCDDRVAISMYGPEKLPRPIGLEEIDAGRYPALPADATVRDDHGFGMLRHVTHVATASWELGDTPPEDALRGRLTRTGSYLYADGLVLPAYGESNTAPYPLMSWWALLFSLSIFARYHPTLWVTSLDPDRSELAVPLQALLDTAPDAVASLVWEALSPSQPEALGIAQTGWTRLSNEERAELDAAVAKRGNRWSDLRTT